VVERDHALSMKEAVADVDRARLDLKTSPVRSAIDKERFRLGLEEAEAVYKQVQTEVPLMKVSLQSQWKSAELARDEGYAELKRVEANVDRMLLKAPMDGLVVMMTVMRRGSADQAQIKVGDQVRTGQPIMQIVDLSSMVVNASVNQADARQIRVGAKARVRFDAYPDLDLPAEVYGLGAMPRASQFRADYLSEVPVTLRLLRLDPRVIPDLSVSADVILEMEPQTVVAPLESIFRDGPEGRPYVFLREPAGWARREVELGKKNYLSAAVRSGLRAGDVVATSRPQLENTGKKQ
jgi:HlyD family secretion protein